MRLNTDIHLVPRLRVSGGTGAPAGEGGGCSPSLKERFKKNHRFYVIITLQTKSSTEFG